MDKPLIVVTDPVHPAVLEALRARFRVMICDDVRHDRAAALAGSASWWAAFRAATPTPSKPISST